MRNWRFAKPAEESGAPTGVTSRSAPLSFSTNVPPAIRCPDAFKELPQLPVSMQSHTAQRPVSDMTLSIYSQDEMPRSSSVYADDVSPPDSPDTPAQHRAADQASVNVSPISATPSPTFPHSPVLSSSGSKKYNSNLPVPKSNTKKFWKLPGSIKGSENPDTSTVRWDEYSGEPTAGERGKPPSATPGSIKLRETPGSLKLRPNFGTSTTISSNNAPARKRVGGREIAEAPIVMRPEWKGAGGRHSIVKPLFDKPLPAGQDHSLPAGTYKQWQEDQNMRKMYEDMQAKEDGRRIAEQADIDRLEREQEADESAKRMTERAQQDQRERERDQQQRLARVRIEKAKRERERILQAQEQSERRVKERSDKITSLVPDPLRMATSPSAPAQDDMPEKRIAPLTAQPTVTQAAISDPLNAPSSSSAFSGVTASALQDPARLMPDSREGDVRSPLARNPSTEEFEGRDNDPSSGISPKTFNEPPMKKTQLDADRTDLTQSSPFAESSFPTAFSQVSLENQLRSRFSATTIATTTYDTSPPQTPDLQQGGPTATNTPDSILNRKRPVAPAGMVRRKPTPAHLGTSNGLPRSDSKSLPKPPADAETVDPIQTLQAKVDVLRRRRKNLETVIHELTHVAQPTSLAYDRASRAEIQKTVAGLEKELAEVVKDEYDTGLRLHRAWKRHEDFAAYEPTSIWVRRVTR